MENGVYTYWMCTYGRSVYTYGRKRKGCVTMEGVHVFLWKGCKGCVPCVRCIPKKEGCVPKEGRKRCARIYGQCLPILHSHS